jgi:cyclic pyranopterin phosphate synthase
VSLDSLDEARFRAMNDADFPVAKVLAAIDAAASAGLAPIKVNMVVKRGVNDHQVVDMARHFRGTGHIVRFIEYMDVGSTNGWRMDDVVPRRKSWPHRRAFPLEPVDAHYPGKSPSAGATPTARRDRRDLLGHARLLLDLHARAAVHRRAALHVPLRATRLRPAGAAARRRERRRARGRDPRHLAAARDRYSEIRTAATAASRKVEMSFIGG